MNNTFNKYQFISPCCKAFTYYDNITLYCSKCKKAIRKLQDGESVTISVKFNQNRDNHDSGDLSQTFKNKAPRFATDRTCRICDVKCPKCNVFMRYMNSGKSPVLVCSNKDCRNVIEE